MSFANLMFLGSCVVVLLACFAMTVYTLVFVADGEISWGSNMGTVVVRAIFEVVGAGLCGAGQMENFKMWKMGHGGRYGQLAL